MKMYIKIKFTDKVVRIQEVEKIEYKVQGDKIVISGYTMNAKSLSVYLDGSLIEHVDIEDE